MDPMRPTRARLLIGIVAVSAAAGWGAVQLVDAWLGRVVPVPGLAAGAMWLLAGALLYWTVTSRPRLQHRPGVKPMPPLVAARSAALALAASRIGSLFAGCYAGIAIAMVPWLGTPTGAATLMSAAAASVGAFILVAAGLWLEHLCRLPVGPTDPDRV